MKYSKQKPDVGRFDYIIQNQTPKSTFLDGSGKYSSILKYLNEASSRRKANVKWYLLDNTDLNYGCSLNSIVATRDIQKGEELLIIYDKHKGPQIKK